MLRRLKILADVPVASVGSDGPGVGGRRGGFRGRRPVPEGVALRDARYYDVIRPAGNRQLRRLGVVRIEDGATMVGAEASCLQVWTAYDDRKPPIEDAVHLMQRRQIRALLKVSALPQAEWALLRYFELYGVEGVTRYAVQKAFGKHCADDALKRLQAIARIAEKPQQPRAAGTPEDVFAILPAETRGRFAAHLTRKRHPSIPKIEELHASRIARLPEGAIRLLGAVAMVDGSASRLALATRGQLVRFAERWADILADVDPGDADACARTMRCYFDTGAGTHDTELTRLMACDGWFRLVRSSVACARLVLGKEAHLIIDRLPALREPNEKLAADLAKARKALVNRKLAARTSLVTDVVARLMTVQAVIENRVYQLESLLARCMEALPKAAALLDAGLSAGFSWTGPVIRAEGSLRNGEQTVSFSFKRESTLLLDAHRRDSEDRNVLKRLPSVSDLPKGLRGSKHSPADWNRIHVVYEGTTAAGAGVDPVEPFFVDLFRWGLLDPDGMSSGLVRNGRREIFDRLCLPGRLRIPEGLLTHSKATRLVAHLARGKDPLSGDGDVIMPLVPLYHALAYAHVALRYGIRWGARLGEIMQIRRGCQRKHKVGGVWRPYFELKPKGWKVMGKFGIDVGTAKALTQVRAFTSARWYGWRPGTDERPPLPNLPFGDCNRRDIEDGGFFFRSRKRALSPANMTLFARILVADVVDMRSHDGRYVLATALGLDGVGYDAFGELLHHSPTSAMPKRYDLSALVRSDAAAERFNRSVDAGVLGMVAGGYDQDVPQPLGRCRSGDRR